MKKKLESELVSIAHRILKLKGEEDVVKMYEEVALLHEKLAVLKFAHENAIDKLPTIENNSSFFNTLDQAFNNKISDTIEVEDKIFINLDDVQTDEIMEPVINKIKDMVSHMPEVPTQENTIDDDFERLVADFKETPVFEPISKTQNNLSTYGNPLNNTLKTTSFNIGLNDKIAFIKHLFDGNNDDYNRVISQLNTIDCFDNAKRFIDNMVKPDYNNWIGKEAYQERFIQIIEAKLK